MNVRYKRLNSGGGFDVRMAVL